MPTTYLDLTNRVLNKFNEVNLTSSTFADTRGVHSVAKNGVQEAIAEIDKLKVRWPFNAAEHTFDLGVGVEEYAWPDNFKFVDWRSFQIQKDETLNIGNQTLNFINRSEWYDHLKDDDNDTEALGAGVPRYVFPSHGVGFGVSPVPNEEYSLKFRYYIFTVLPTLYSDTTTIPSQWDYVILQGALPRMYMFYDNPERADASRAVFDKLVQDMQTILIPADFHVTNKMVNRGGGVSRIRGL